jgi:protein-tyrosine phosphatase
MYRNICRSPIGERFLQGMPNKKIDSAGTGALVDHSADESAIKIAEKHGISLAGHKGRQFTSALSRQYDLILVMEKSILNKLDALLPKPEEKQCCLVNG